jgi:hypothetical protein
MENYKELYALSQAVFKEELDRFNSIEQKASQYLSVLTLLLGATAFFLKWLVENFIPPHGALESVLLALASGILICLFVSWFSIFSALKIYKVEIIPLNNLWFDFFANNRLVDIYYHLSARMKEGREKNRATLNRKGRWLNFGYNSMRVAVVFLILFGLLFVAYKWRKTQTQPSGATQNATTN